MDIKAKQGRWASDAAVACEGEYCVDPKSNVPWLSKQTLAEFLEADGNEFDDKDGRAKIAALHSSSALAVNVFDYWRERDKSPLAGALGRGPRRVEALSFERKFPTGVGPRSPNIDVVLTLEGDGLLAIESKFTEWTGNAGRKSLREAYLPEGTKRWAAVGLSGAQRVAEAYKQGTGFNRLDVPQLLKHMLGLATQKPSPDWHLLLLWHRCDEVLAAQMDEEIQRFEGLLGADGTRFSSLTYQEFWERLRASLTRDHSEYVSYIQKRYF
jgi:hypothetical protein